MYFPTERTEVDYQIGCKRVLGILFTEDATDEFILSRLDELCGLSNTGSNICEIDALVRYLGNRSYIKYRFERCEIRGTFYTRGIKVTKLTKHLCDIQFEEDTTE